MPPAPVRKLERPAGMEVGSTWRKDVAVSPKWQPLQVLSENWWRAHASRLSVGSTLACQWSGGEVRALPPRKGMPPNCPGTLKVAEQSSGSVGTLAGTPASTSLSTKESVTACGV